MSRMVIVGGRIIGLSIAWAGLRPASYDGLPYLGRLPGLDNGWVAAGHFRNGLQLSTGTAVVMADLIQGKLPVIDTAPLDPGRVGHVLWE